ncbi:MAG TPA: DUF4286 family protein [Bacteroidales bacterium]|nr:DUF4286 family protein [Bacteroidales bacterium]
MLIYNTTYLVADKQFEPWMKWVREVHIPFMLNCGFSNPQVAKVLTTDPEQEGTSISVQFQIEDLRKLSIWDKEHAEMLLCELSERFGSEVLAFSTVLEVL